MRSLRRLLLLLLLVFPATLLLRGSPGGEGWAVGRGARPGGREPPWDQAGVRPEAAAAPPGSGYPRGLRSPSRPRSAASGPHPRLRRAVRPGAAGPTEARSRPRRVRGPPGAQARREANWAGARGEGGGGGGRARRAGALRGR